MWAHTSLSVLTVITPLSVSSRQLGFSRVLTNTGHGLFSQIRRQEVDRRTRTLKKVQVLSALIRSRVHMSVDCFTLYVSLTSALPASLPPPPYTPLSPTPDPTPLIPPKPAAGPFNWKKKSSCGEWKLGCGVINYITAEAFLSGRVATVLNNAMVKEAREHKEEDLT